MAENETPIPLIQITVSEIMQGDIFNNGDWTALNNAFRLHDQHVQVDVQYRDGGTGQRVWNNPEHLIEVERPESTPA